MSGTMTASLPRRWTKVLPLMILAPIVMVALCESRESRAEDPARPEDAPRFRLVRQLTPPRIQSDHDHPFLAAPFPAFEILVGLQPASAAEQCALVAWTVPAFERTREVAIDLSYDKAYTIVPRPRHNEVLVAHPEALLLYSVPDLGLVGRIEPPQDKRWHHGQSTSPVVSLDADGNTCYAVLSWMESRSEREQAARVNLDERSVNVLYDVPGPPHSLKRITQLSPWPERGELLEIRSQSTVIRRNADTGAILGIRRSPGFVHLPHPERDGWLSIDMMISFTPRDRGSAPEELLGEPEASWNAILDLERKRLILCDCLLRTKRWPDLTTERTIPAHQSGIHHLVLSNDGKWLFGASWSQEWTLWDLDTGDRILWDLGPGKTYDLMFSPDGEYLVGDSPSGCVLRDVDNEHGTRYMAARRGPALKYALAVEKEDGEFVGPFALHSKHVAFHPDGKRCLLYFQPGAYELRNVATDEILAAWQFEPPEGWDGMDLWPEWPLAINQRKLVHLSGDIYLMLSEDWRSPPHPRSSR